MAFRTKLDFSNNRQVRQHIETTTVLSGATNFGVPFSSLPAGINPSTTGETEFYSTVLSTFSGNGTTSVYTWFDPRMQLGAASLSAITPTTSATTQIVDPVFAVATTTIIDGNTVGLSYSGVTFDITPIAVYDLGGGNYSGTVETDFYSVLSASTIDFTGRTIWVDVSGITRTERLIITDTPILGYVWTCIDSEGMGAWLPSSGSSGTTIWINGIGVSSAMLNGALNDASGDYSVAEGSTTIASGNYSHAEGKGTVASNAGSHAEGSTTIASGVSSHAEGNAAIASGDYAHAEGSTTLAEGDNSHAEGEGTVASFPWSHAEGYATFANNRAAHAEGNQTTASGAASHAEGYATIASGELSHAEGYQTQAAGDNSHAEGSLTYAGVNSHAEGNQTYATATSHAEGYQTSATTQFCHSEGWLTRASGNQSHAGGYNSVATGISSFVHGHDSTVSGNYSIVLGRSIIGATADTTYVDYLNVKRVLATAFANDIRIDANGNLTTNTSDERLKENINPLTGALDKIKAIQGVTYQWKDRNAGGDAVRLGFIAQQVEQVEPLLVFTNKNDENEYKGLHIDGIIPLLVEAVKELSTSGVTENKYLQTQTILAEDNNIDLNYNGTQESSVGGGIRVLNVNGVDTAAELIIDSEGNWTTNNDFKAKSITIPEYTPTSSSDESGNLGNVTRDDDYIYIKTSTGWKRANLESF
ncbi:MAG: hypothetical protein E6R13_02940 [Spirochaetes bacterium]|nr:MAG: hypothetical protein E6R13_02940 [Spirochaetota bacterium]